MTNNKALEEEKCCECVNGFLLFSDKESEKCPCPCHTPTPSSEKSCCPNCYKPDGCAMRDYCPCHRLTPSESWEEEEKEIMCRMHRPDKNCECCKNTLRALLLKDEVSKHYDSVVFLERQKTREQTLLEVEGVIRSKLQPDDYESIGSDRVLDEILLKLKELRSK